jgi:hypothetical protein
MISRVNRFNWDRWDFVGGILFSALFIISLALAGEAGDTPREVQRFYTDEGNRGQQFFSYFLFLAGILAFLWFLSALRILLLRAEGEPARLTALAFGSGLVAATMFLGAISLFVASAGVADDDDFRFNPNTANFVMTAGYGFFVAGVVVAALFVLATSLVALRTRFLPVWLAWLGFPVALSMFFAIFFWPVFLFLAWIFLVSVVLVAWRWIGPRPTAAA